MELFDPSLVDEESVIINWARQFQSGFGTLVRPVSGCELLGNCCIL